MDGLAGLEMGVMGLRRCGAAHPSLEVTCIKAGPCQPGEFHLAEDEHKVLIKWRQDEQEIQP